ncbi:MAG: hypothetical protein M5U09_19295 [Gammaproteobacteria bacterium]|nr:hypothetical protein [Gammaproteobacteria bacterium]
MTTALGVESFDLAEAARHSAITASSMLTRSTETMTSCASPAGELIASAVVVNGSSTWFEIRARNCPRR